MKTVILSCLIGVSGYLYGTHNTVSKDFAADAVTVAYEIGRESVIMEVIE